MTLAEALVPRAIGEVTAGWLSEAMRADHACQNL